MNRARGGIAKHRIRFSIGAMLAIMASVAVLLNHEVQRAKAIETAVKQMADLGGQLGFRPRAGMPNSLANMLPLSWTQEINGIWLTAYKKESLEALPPWRPNRVIDSSEFENVLGLGALDNLKFAVLQGSAINKAVVFNICNTSTTENCYLTNVSLSDDEIDELRQFVPHCKIDVVK